MIENVDIDTGLNWASLGGGGLRVIENVDIDTGLNWASLGGEGSG